MEIITILDERAGKKHSVVSCLAEILTRWEELKVHHYLSTACYHREHEKCGLMQFERGDLTDPHCKYCTAKCECDCHKVEKEMLLDPALGDTEAINPTTLFDDEGMKW